MADERDTMRPGEKAIVMPAAGDATLVFIGKIETPWTNRRDCPRQGDFDGPLCRLILDPVWIEALAGIERSPFLQVLYWMHQARRDLVLLAPAKGETVKGPFALRAPTRPNPIAPSIVKLVERRDGVILVQGLDCLNGTPLLDIKPHRGAV